jgi:hypothetical protein
MDIYYFVGVCCEGPCGKYGRRVLERTIARLVEHLWRPHTRLSWTRPPFAGTRTFRQMRLQQISKKSFL